MLGFKLWRENFEDIIRKLTIFEVFLYLGQFWKKRASYGERLAVLLCLILLRNIFIDSSYWWAWLGINYSRLLQLRLALLPRFKISPLLKRFGDEATVYLYLEVRLSLILKIPRTLPTDMISLRGALEENVKDLSLRLCLSGWQQARGRMPLMIVG